MRIQWYGQSAFLLEGDHSVFIDPFAALEGLADRGLRFDYQPIEGVEADLLLVTHALNFLDPPDAFLDALDARVEKLTGSELVAEQLLGTAGEPTVALPAAPAAE